LYSSPAMIHYGSREYSLDLAGRTLTFTIRKSEKAKNLRIQADAESGLEVVVPAAYDLKNLDQIILKKQEWILKRLDKYERERESIRAWRKQCRGRVLYRGREYEVETRVRHGMKNHVVIEENRLIVYVPDDVQGTAVRVLDIG